MILFLTFQLLKEKVNFKKNVDFLNDLQKIIIQHFVGIFEITFHVGIKRNFNILRSK